MEIKLQSPFLPLLLCLLLLFLPSISAIDSNGGKRTYIVRVDRDAKPSIFPTHAHWYETTVAAVTASADGAAAAAWTTGGPIIHTYSSIFHGFSARLSPAAASNLSSFHGVVAVLPEQVRRPLTTRSPRFLGLLSSDRSGLLAETDFGSDLVPAKWKGACVAGAAFPATACNRKLIGARYFSGGYEATSGRMNESAELRSPRDTDGHGTHTASIAAGGVCATEGGGGEKEGGGRRGGGGGGEGGEEREAEDDFTLHPTIHGPVKKKPIKYINL